MRRTLELALAVPLALLSCTNAPGTSGDGGPGAIDAARGNPPCGTGDWTMYGHDARHTSASDGCVTGPFKVAWSYVPANTNTDGVEKVDNVVTSGGTLYVRYDGSYGPSLAGVTGAGREMWSWAVPAGADQPTSTWATVAMGVVLVEDDGLFLVDATTGKTRGPAQNWDDWGQSASDGVRFYVNSEVNSVDGLGLYVGAYDSSGTLLWQKDHYNTCGTSVSSTYGSLAVDGGKIFRAGVYSSTSGMTSPIPSGIRVFDAVTGVPGFTVTTTPASALSAADGRIYLVEGAAGATALVARRQSDGGVAWSQPVSSPSVQAPVLAAGRVIIAAATDVRAFDASTGAPAWTAPGIAAATSPKTKTEVFGRCSSSTIAFGNLPDTSLAAALGSGTLVVTARDGVHVLSLRDGTDQWHGTPAGATGPLKNPVVVGTVVYAVDAGAGSTGRLVALTAP